MICQICKSVIADSATCPVCGANIDPADFDARDFPWLMIYTTNTLIDAEMFKANLESAGIPVHILSQIDSTRQLTLGDLAIVKIYVPSIYESDAKAIIQQIESGNGINSVNSEL